MSEPDLFVKMSCKLRMGAGDFADLVGRESGYPFWAKACEEEGDPNPHPKLEGNPNPLLLLQNKKAAHCELWNFGVHPIKVKGVISYKKLYFCSLI